MERRQSIVGKKNPAYSHGFATRLSGKSKEYNIWVMIRQRVNNSNNYDYPHYGGIGIKICDRWKSFKNFIEDMGPAPTPKHSIDRIDNNGNYEPGNCRWATVTEQANNKHTNIVLTINGESHTLADWSRIAGIKYTILYDRFKRNWPIEKLFIPKTK
jgi:hypothetical protein